MALRTPSGKLLEPTPMALSVVHNFHNLIEFFKVMMRVTTQK